MSQRRRPWHRIGTFALIVAWFVVDGLRPKPKTKPKTEPKTEPKPKTNT